MNRRFRIYKVVKFTLSLPNEYSHIWIYGQIVKGFFGGNCLSSGHKYYLIWVKMLLAIHQYHCINIMMKKAHVIMFPGFLPVLHTIGIKQAHAVGHLQMGFQNSLHQSLEAFLTEMQLWLVALFSGELIRPLYTSGRVEPFNP